MNAEFKHTIALGELQGRYRPLIQALEDAGVPEEQWQPLLQNCLSLRCIQCGASISGSSLIALAGPDAEAIAASPDLQRLNDKHCLAENCPSMFYNLCFSPTEGIDWEGIWMAADDLRKESQLRAAGLDRSWVKRLIEKHGIVPLTVAATAIVAVACLVCLRLRTPSWARPIPVYRVDTNAVAGE